MSAPPRRPWLGLQATLATQVLATFSLSVAPVLAPAVAPQLGLAPERVGLFTGLAYALAMLAGLGSGAWVARHGATRLMQAAMACMAAGLLLMAVGEPGLFLLAAIVMGAGYGSTNPATADILGRHAPLRSAGLFFALKQTGVPIGVGLAGLLMPLGLAVLGWQASLFAAGASSLVLALLLQRVARSLDARDARDAAPAPAQAGWGEAMRLVLRRPGLRNLSLGSFAYAMAQLGFLTFVVALLHLERGLPLGVAAGLLSASQLVCVFVRVGTGYLSDRWASPRTVLAALGVGAAASFTLLALLPASAPTSLLAVAVMACGATSMGWNGVYFAQIVRSVEPHELAASAGAVQFFTFGGGLVAPVLFGLWLAQGASHASGYLALAGVAGAGAVLMLRSAPPAGQPSTSSSVSHEHS
ncbi:MFS transporter [Ramlibacter rhizophilus]|uniref:MFS transporter n=1 Tax=Ramlibacter rhizophilus TaxID=1781167 RepID=A0A4Z0C2H0_9BURK|nr:MFS transporter [Ramlibacter rhizophilus]TFZ04409.1 MFS transporter [Ramlibacter rhizophilus]